jgi:hypothetical protein
MLADHCISARFLSGEFVDADSEIFGFTTTAGTNPSGWRIFDRSLRVLIS